jgi:hypothetical protein
MCKEDKGEVEEFLYQHADIIDELTSFMKLKSSDRMHIDQSAYFDSISSKQRPLVYPNQQDLEHIHMFLIGQLDYLRQNFPKDSIGFVMAADCLFRIWATYPFQDVDLNLLPSKSLSKVIVTLVRKLHSIGLDKGVDKFEVTREMEVLRLLSFLVGHCNQDALIVAADERTADDICTAMIEELIEKNPFYLDYKQFVDRM